MTKHVTLAFFQLSASGGRYRARACTEACPSDIARPRTIGVAECCNGLWRIGGSGLKQTQTRSNNSVLRGRSHRSIRKLQHVRGVASAYPRTHTGVARMERTEREKGIASCICNLKLAWIRPYARSEKGACIKHVAISAATR